jgi:hypothetical protein
MGAVRGGGKKPTKTVWEYSVWDGCVLLPNPGQPLLPVPAVSHFRNILPLLWRNLGRRISWNVSPWPYGSIVIRIQTEPCNIYIVMQKFSMALSLLCFWTHQNQVLRIRISKIQELQRLKIEQWTWRAVVAHNEARWGSWSHGGL